ncbi:ComEC/Rec2 family competence protein [Christiangramia echinicola]|uniref:Competence protein ComEC n=1 Tax=Christiangramia echinicola TaxID=279359 RepID=A0A1H1NTI6_9FLAO|nr:ComEC/Rec2 family competence protein [Christiangramia echinicola]SDS02075.1 competence protein ComEC [Christiangramia echinicola]
MKNFQFIFLRLAIYLIAGILLAFTVEITKAQILFTGILILVLYLFTFYRAQKTLFPDALAGISTYSLIFFLGFSTAYFNKPENQPRHYLNQNIEETDSLFLHGRILEELKPSAYSKKFIVEARQIISQNSKNAINGKILLNINHDSLITPEINPGSMILIPWKPEQINAALNPFQFSYQDYMSNLQVERQLKINIPELKRTGYESDIRSLAWNTREEIISTLRDLNFGKNELAVFQALILGQRRDVSDKLYKDYASAGAIHILAISGLHIGILLVLLNLLFKPIEKVRNGKIIKAFLIILLLWSFAFLTGLSASVVRAVCMFSFLAIGLQLKRKTSSLNSLFLSLFFLLLINPYYVFQVGFQLSYLAVFSIITFQPIIYRLFSSDFKFIDYFWKLTSVSIAAQIGVIPLSIYYFHQFPGLFLVTNLIVLPFLGLILISGITVILMASLKILPGFLEDAFSLLLRILNEFIGKIAEFDAFVISNIRLSLLQNLSLYVIVLSVLLLIRKLNFYRLSFLLISILIFQATTFYSKISIPENESIVFHKSRLSILAEKVGDELKIYSDSLNNANILKDYLRERQIENIAYQSLPHIINLSGKLSLVIDTAGNYRLNNFKPQLLILRNSPRINLDRLLTMYSPEQIIADGSNYSSYIKKWKNTALKQKIPFHHTGEKGALIIKNE